MTATLWNRISLILSAAGVFVSGFLTMSHVLGKQIPCGLTDDCARVALHPSSQWFGIPVAAFGLGAYLLLGALALVRMPATGARYGKLAFLSLMISAVGLGVSVYLTYTSLVVIQASCKWCLSSAVIMIVLFLVHAVLVQSEPPVDSAPDSPSSTHGQDMLTWGGVVGILVLGSLAYGYKNLQGQSAYGKSVVELAKTLTPDKVVLSESHFIGPKSADITVVEFADFYCPSCRQAYEDMHKVMEQYSTKIRFAFSNYPLFEKEGHEQSLMAAAFTIYADEKGHYWDVVQRLFEVKVEEITGEEQLLAVLQSTGLDTADFMKRFKSGDAKLLDPLAKVQADATKYGVDRTPTWIIFAKGQTPRYVSNRLSDALNEPQYQALLK